ncbi:MAG: zinc ABC transporter substrate-binding protein [Elusimicrobia bacterium]|nr:zinc ABC transporter substrate-binding protein [Elusimicrobiota bacterium]
MKIYRILILSLSTIYCLLSTSHAAKLNVVTTTEDMAALAREVGGDLINVETIAKGYQDPHFVDAKPSYLLKLKKADLFIQIGLELEVGWAPPLLTNARNSKILPGNPGFLEASQGCDILQKSAGVVDRSLGDVHPLGNPHFWLDPNNGKTIAKSIAQRLSALDGAHAKDYQANLERFETKLSGKEKEWDKLISQSNIKGIKVVTYHNSWPNFAGRFGLNVVNFIEPKPGIPAAPAHVQALIQQIKSEKITLLLIEPYFDDKLPKKIAKETGAKLLIFLPSVGAKEGVKTYFDLFDYNLNLLKEALGARG